MAAGVGHRCGPSGVSAAIPAQLPLVRDRNPDRRFFRQVTPDGFRSPSGASGRYVDVRGSTAPVSPVGGGPFEQSRVSPSRPSGSVATRRYLVRRQPGWFGSHNRCAAPPAAGMRQISGSPPASTAQPKYSRPSGSQATPAKLPRGAARRRIGTSASGSFAPEPVV